MACFLNTELEHISCNLVWSLWGCHYVDWCCLDSRGASGRILLMWDRKVVEKVEECVGEFSVVCSLRNVDDYFSLA